MSRQAVADQSIAGETEWLGRVREVRHPIDPSHPMRVTRRRHIDGGPLPCPSAAYPEMHPYCEVNFAIDGKGEQFVGMESVVRSGGDMMLLGPGIPHYTMLLEYPSYSISVHFLPVLFFGMGSEGDGARLLARFTTSRSISQRIVRPSPALQARFAEQFENMAEEFEHPKLCSEIRIRLLLINVLIELLRWEESTSRALPHHSTSSNWGRIEKVLHFIYQHYSEPLYIEQIAREAGVGAKGLQRIFHEAFGMSCIQYLGAYRISHAMSLLCLPGARVTEVALAVGFETLSHFNSTFRRVKGMSPTKYARSQKTGE